MLEIIHQKPNCKEAFEKRTGLNIDPNKHPTQKNIPSLAY